MSVYSKEIREKSTEELLKELEQESQYSKQYSDEVRKEIKRRGIDVTANGASALSVHERRQRCERCKNHSNENPWVNQFQASNYQQYQNVP